MIDALLSLTKTHSAPLQFVALIDVAVSVLIRLKNDDRPPVERLPEDLKVLPTALPHYTNYFTERNIERDRRSLFQYGSPF